MLKYLPGAELEDFVSLTMPVREQAWRWPRDLFPFFRQNLPEGYLLGVIREEFSPLLDGTDLSLLGVVGGTGIGRVSVTPEGIQPGVEMAPLEISHLLKAENTTERFAALVRQYARGPALRQQPARPDHRWQTNLDTGSITGNIFQGRAGHSPEPVRGHGRATVRIRR